MKLTPAIRAALYAETGAYTDRDAYVSDMALSSVWGDAEDEEIPAERICAVFWNPAAHRAGLVRRAAGMPAVCGRDGGGDSGCKRTITKTKPVE